MPSPAETAFLTWLTTHGTALSPSISLSPFPSMGRGLLALTDIQPDTLLFSLPRSLLLTTSTSALPSLLPADVWAELGGWSPLILILMYERLRPASVPATTPDWTAYFDLLPEAGSFDSLMFWNEEELGALKGSMVLSKIGKEEAEEEFTTTVRGVVEKYPEVFGDEKAYTLELFHYMGSLILSRSFHVESAEEEEEEDSDDEEEESEDVGDVAMVPMADLLNAKSGCDNVRPPLPSSHPANSLRRTGTTFLCANPPFDDVDHVHPCRIADLQHVRRPSEQRPPPSVRARRRFEPRRPRRDWAGEYRRPRWRGGGDGGIGAGGAGRVAARDRRRRVSPSPLLRGGANERSTFSLDATLALPDELVASIRTFLLDPQEFAKLQTKERPPKSVVDAQVAAYLVAILKKRESEYPTTVQVRSFLPTFLPPSLLP